MKIPKWLKHLYRQLRLTLGKDRQLMEKDVEKMFIDIQNFLGGKILNEITIIVNTRWFLITAGTQTQTISDYFPVSDADVKERIDYLVEKYTYIGQISITKSDIMIISDTYNLIRIDAHD